MWRAHIEGDIRHVWPDDESHDCETMECWCDPKVNVCEGSIITVVHKSKDGREYIEELISEAKENIN